MAAKFLQFSAPFILFDKCTKFYFILTSDICLTQDLYIQIIQILLVTLHFLFKGHKTLNFLFAFFLEISESLKDHIPGTEKDINKG